jgi:hypothetical protein
MLQPAIMQETYYRRNSTTRTGEDIGDLRDTGGVQPPVAGPNAACLRRVVKMRCLVEQRIQPQSRRCNTLNQADDDRQTDHGLDGVQSVGYRHNDSEGATPTPSEGPEQVRVGALRGRHNGSVREHGRHGENVISGCKGEGRGKGDRWPARQGRSTKQI